MGHPLMRWNTRNKEEIPMGYPFMRWNARNKEEIPMGHPFMRWNTRNKEEKRECMKTRLGLFVVGADRAPQDFTTPLLCSIV